MTYKIGTRVKSLKSGVTGVVVGGVTMNGYTLERCRQRIPEADMLVRRDQAWKALDGKTHPPGTVGWASSPYWIPIMDPGAAPGIKGTCKPLDHLLSRLKGVEA